MSHHKEPFYGKDVYRNQEQIYINKLLSKYDNEPATEELKKKIWDELQMEKHHGRITIPFKVVIERDAYRKFPPAIVVILDTKV